MSFMRCAGVVALVLGAGVGTGSCQEPKPKAAKLALVAPQAAATTLNLLDLAQAELTREDRVQLLERQTIERVLKEQRLSLSGLVDAAAAVKVGQLLATDLFGILETSSAGKEAIGLVIYDAATGVKFVDKALPTGEGAAVTTAIVEAIRTALTRREQGPKGLKYVGVLAVRNADLPRDKDGLCQSLAAVLERELVNSPGVGLLERKRLEWLNKEKTLTRNADTERILGALFSLELEFSRPSEGKGLRVSAWLSDSKGKRLNTIRVAGKDAQGADLTEPLAAAIRKQLQVAEPPKAVDRRLEAKRFVAEAVLLWSFQQGPSALEALEAALALDPAIHQAKLYQVEYLSLLADRLLHNEMKGGVRVAVLAPVKPEPAQAIMATHLRALELHLDLLAQFEARSAQAAVVNVFTPLWTRTRHGETSKWTFLIAADSLPAEWKELRDHAQATYLQLLKKQSHLLAELTRREPIWVLTWSRYLQHEQALAHGKHPAKTRVLVQGMTDVAREWSEVTRQPKVLAYLLGPQLLQQFDTWTLRLMDLDAEALEDLATHPHPWLALDARVYLVRSRLDPKATAEERYQAYLEARKAYVKALQASKQLKDAEQRDALTRRVYTSWRSSVQYWGTGTKNIVTEMTFLIDFMLDQQDLHREVLLWIRPHKSFIGPTPAERWRLLRKALAVVDASPRRTEPELREVRTTLLHYRDAILQLEPDLAATDPKLAAERLPEDLAPPWNARLLIHVKDYPELKTFRYPMVYGERLYCLGVAGDGRATVPGASVGLVRIPLDDGKPEVLGRCPLTVAKTTWAVQSAITSCCLGGETVYVGTEQDGILALPLSGEPGRKLDLDLPSPKALALAYLDDKLYAHLDGGYLVEVNPRTKAVVTLASSRRREQLSPLDDAEPFTMPFLTADAARGRLLFLLLQPTAKTAAPGRKGTNGFWEYDVKAGRFTRLLETIANTGPASESQLLRIGTPLRDGKFLLSSFSATVEFDATTNKARLLRCTGVSPVPALRPDTALTAAAPKQFGIASLRHNNWLWSVSGLSVDRLSLNGRLERFPSLGNGIPRLWSPTAAYLELLGPDALLVGGSEGFALCRLRRESDPLAASQPDAREK